MSGSHPVHGYRSQHLQLDGRIGEQYVMDGTVEQFFWDTCYLIPPSSSNLFYLTLPSNNSMDYFPDNTLTHFTTRLPQMKDLDRSWEIGLAEIQYPYSWYNIKK